jgi:hypothetical protein
LKAVNATQKEIYATKKVWCNWSVCWICKNLLKGAFTKGHISC